MVAREIEAAGGIAKEFNTIAIDDGIAMGHTACSIRCRRDLIADSVEYMVNAHLRRRHGLHLQLRQDHPGDADGRHAPEHPGVLSPVARWRPARSSCRIKVVHLDLVDAMVKAADASVSRPTR